MRPGEPPAATSEPGIVVEPVVVTSLARPWNVVAHDDPITLMTYVTMVFQRIFGYSLEKAERLMHEVHETGRSVVWTGAREEAELYVHKLHAAFIKATIEQADA